MKRNKTLNGVTLSERTGITELLRARKIYDMAAAAKITGRCVRWLRRLCHEGKVDHHKLLGRYYMTPQEVAALLTPVKARRQP